MSINKRNAQLHIRNVIVVEGELRSISINICYSKDETYVDQPTYIGRYTG